MTTEIQGLKAVGVRKTPGEYLKIAVLALQQRFWSKVTGAGDDCWIWQGARMRTGYGQIIHAGKPYLAHRMAYLLCLGPIPAHNTVLHRCKIRLCVNPSHLFAGKGRIGF